MCGCCLADSSGLSNDVRSLNCLSIYVSKAQVAKDILKYTHSTIYGQPLEEKLGAFPGLQTPVLAID